MADPLRSTDEVHGVVMNERGEVFVTGRTNSLDFPGTMGVPSGGSGQDAFVTKFLPDGRRAWSRGFGGSGTDSARRLALGPSGELYVVGRTTSPSILPGSGDSFQTKLTHQGGTDAFLARLSAEGQLEWFMYLGGGEEDRGLDVAVTADGKKVYVSGSTTSAMQAPPGEEYGLRGSGYDAFILQVDVSTANAPEHMWTRFIGTKSLVSNADDEAYAVAVRGDAVYVGGVVGSRLTDVDSSYKPIKLYQEGAYDGFVARLSSTGDVVWFTHVGANGEDEVQDLLVRPAGELIVVGETNSSSFSTVPSLGGYDAFVLQLGADGKETGQVKRLGGNGDDKVEGHAAMDPSGNVFVGGRTVSDKIASRGFDNTFEPTSDGFVMMVNPELTRVVWASYVGGSVGSREEWVRGVAVDTQGRLALGGHSPSTTSFLESGGGAEDPPKGGEEGFVIGVRMDLTAPLAGAVTAGVTPEGWLSATWTDFQEPETAIVEYAWAISTPEGTLVRDFTVKETLEDTRVVVE
ncbi:MAG TPA: hypothetical protein VEU33_08300, partial [Archangium sp.]|nr:hypothetical protein [Archangium sp.]